MRVLLGQLSPIPGDIAANVQTVSDALADHAGADLAVFPELFLGGYDLDRVADLALPIDDPAIDALRGAARGAATALVVGFAEALPGGCVANTAACIDADGSIAGTYRKTHLFGPGEQQAFVAGDALRVVTLAGRRVGVLVCFDMEFPEPARALTRAGADILVTASANMEPYGSDHALAARARALDNRRPHVYVNRCGAEAGLRFVGASAAIRPDGSVQHELGGAAELVCLDLDDSFTVGAHADYTQHLRAHLAVEASQPNATPGAIT